MDTTRTVPRWPCYRLTTVADGRIGLEGPAARPGPYSTREDATAAVAALATMINRPVRAQAADADGTVWPLIISPEATVTEAGPALKPKRRSSTPAAPAKLSPAVAPPLADSPAQAARTIPPRRRAAPAPRSARKEIQQQSAARRPVVPTVLTIRALERSGDIQQAADLASDFEHGAAQAHGPSHPDAVHARELHAYLRARLGDLPTAARLYRDVAERQWHRGDHTAAHASAAAAHSAWLQISDPVQAADVGRAIVRMRTLIPGEGMRAYHNARSHQAKLEQPS